MIDHTLFHAIRVEFRVIYSISGLGIYAIIAQMDKSHRLLPDKANPSRPSPTFAELYKIGLSSFMG